MVQLNESTVGRVSDSLTDLGCREEIGHNIQGLVIICLYGGNGRHCAGYADGSAEVECPILYERERLINLFEHRNGMSRLS